jgi:hypothetical protein
MYLDDQGSTATIQMMCLGLINQQDVLLLLISGSTKRNKKKGTTIMQARL